MSNQSNKINFIFVDQSFDPKALVANTVYNIVSIATTAAMAIPTFISIAVFAHPKLKDPAFKILITVAIVDFSYMFLRADALHVRLERPAVRFHHGPADHELSHELYGPVYHSIRDISNRAADASYKK
jgi:hypothetical protein